MINKINLSHPDYLLLNKAINKVRQPDYKPTDDINAFWARYRLQEVLAKAYGFFLCKKGGQENHTPQEEWHQFTEDLLAFIIGSYFHFAPLDVFEKGAIEIDPEKSFPSDPPPPKDVHDVIIKTLFGQY